MAHPLGYIGFEFKDDENLIQNDAEDKKNSSEQEKLLESTRKALECTETMPEDSEPIPAKSLDFEEAFQKHQLSEEYESPFKNIPFLKDDVLTVNTMSHCPPDDIAKLIRNIQNSVYTLGLEEARQCRRGKLLNVLKTTDRTPRLLQPTPPKITRSVEEKTTASL